MVLDSASTQSTFLFSGSILTNLVVWSSMRLVLTSGGTVVVEMLCLLVNVDEAVAKVAEVVSDVLEDMEVVKVVVAEVAVEDAASDDADKSDSF